MQTMLAKLLVIDDDYFLRENISEFFEDREWDFFGAENGMLGLELFRREAPDLVLLDLRMPEMDGLEVLKVLHEESPDTPVIVVSGTGVIDDVVKALRLGAWDYLIKPIEDNSILVHAIDKALERSHLIQENRRYSENLEEELQKRTSDLLAAKLAVERKNVTMQELIFSIQDERNKVGKNITSNIERVILPTLSHLGESLPEKQKMIIRQIEQALEEITSPFVDKLSKGVGKLTPAEIRICNLIRRGLLNKQIARQENLSVDTVNTHRRNIRQKLGITHKKVNLTTYLESLFSEEMSG